MTHYFHLFGGMYPEVELLDHLIILCLIFSETTILCSTEATVFCINEHSIFFFFHLFGVRGSRVPTGWSCFGPPSSVSLLWWKRPSLLMDPGNTTLGEESKHHRLGVGRSALCLDRLFLPAGESLPASAGKVMEAQLPAKI